MRAEEVAFTRVGVKRNYVIANANVMDSAKNHKVINGY